MKKFYHASVKFLGNKVVLHPRVPKIKALKSEDDNTKRVSMSGDEIKACIVASYDESHLEDNEIKIHIYETRMVNKTKIIKPTETQVSDVEFYDEYWSLDPISLVYKGYYILYRKDKNWSEYAIYDHIQYANPRGLANWVKYIIKKKFNNVLIP